jgi:hypothetical protein
MFRRYRYRRDLVMLLTKIELSREIKPCMPGVRGPDGVKGPPGVRGPDGIQIPETRN